MKSKRPKQLLIATVGSSVTTGLAFLVMALARTPRTQTRHIWLLTPHGWGMNTGPIALSGLVLGLAQYVMRGATFGKKWLSLRILVFSLVTSVTQVFLMLLAYAPRTQALHFWFLALHGWGMRGRLPATIITGAFVFLQFLFWRKRKSPPDHNWDSYPS